MTPRKSRPTPINTCTRYASLVTIFSFSPQSLGSSRVINYTQAKNGLRLPTMVADVNYPIACRIECTHKIIRPVDVYLKEVTLFVLIRDFIIQNPYIFYH